jgi:hypothetical protein
MDFCLFVFIIDYILLRMVIRFTCPVFTDDTGMEEYACAD